MHSLDYDVKQPGVWSITLNFNSDWSGEVFISWVDAEPPSDQPTLPWLQEHRVECIVNGKELLRGRAKPKPAASEHSAIAMYEIPSLVLTIATWLAINRWWQDKMMRAAEDTYAGGYR